MSLSSSRMWKGDQMNGSTPFLKKDEHIWRMPREAGGSPLCDVAGGDRDIGGRKVLCGVVWCVWKMKVKGEISCASSIKQF